MTIISILDANLSDLDALSSLAILDDYYDYLDNHLNDDDPNFNPNLAPAMLVRKVGRVLLHYGWSETVRPGAPNPMWVHPNHPSHLKLSFWEAAVTQRNQLNQEC